MRLVCSYHLELINVLTRENKTFRTGLRAAKPYYALVMQSKLLHMGEGPVTSIKSSFVP